MGTALIENRLPNLPEGIFRPVGFEKEPTSERLQVSISEIAQRIFHELNEISLQAIRSPNGREFQVLREKIFPSYQNFLMALNNVVLAKLEVDSSFLIEASFDKLKEDFTSKGPSYFGNEACGEVLFSISTLRSANRWIPHLNSARPNDKHRERDAELAREFFSAATWSEFHLSCLELALRRNEPVNQEVFQELLEGLRLSVMAYGYVREALDLRNTLSSRYAEQLKSSWDDEDQALALAE